MSTIKSTIYSISGGATVEPSSFRGTSLGAHAFENPETFTLNDLFAIRAPEDFPMETFLLNLQLDHFMEIEEESEKDAILSKYDAVDLLYAVQHLELHLREIEAENLYLKDFLSVVEPKLINKILQRLATLDRITSPSGGDAVSQATNEYARAQSKSFVRKSAISRRMSGNLDLKLNFKSKAGMCDNSVNILSRQMERMERVAKNEMRLLGARIEELQIANNEVKDAIFNFTMSFLYYPEDIKFLNVATEKQLDNKIRKFIHTWMKTSKMIYADLHIKSISLRKRNKNFYYELLEKMDLAKILSPVDLDLLYRKKDIYEFKLDDVTTQLCGIKGIAGRASSSFVKQTLLDLQKYQKRLLQDIANATEVMKSLTNHKNFAENQNAIQKKELDLLNKKALLYSAPTLDQYIELKRLEAAALKEERMLKRKCAILELQVASARGKQRREKSLEMENTTKLK